MKKQLLELLPGEHIMFRHGMNTFTFIKGNSELPSLVTIDAGDHHGISFSVTKMTEKYIMCHSYTFGWKINKRFQFDEFTPLKK